MKKTLYILVIALMAFGGVACSKDDNDRTSIRGGGKGRDARRGDNDNDSRGKSCNGLRAGQEFEVDSSQNVIDGFVTPMGEPEDVVGLVYNETGGGVFFSMAAEVDGDDIECAILDIEILDEWYINNDVDESLQINSLKFIRGEFTGSNDVSMEFSDSYQTVWVEGRFIGDEFSGEVRFDNKKNNATSSEWKDLDWDGTGELGSFVTDKCDVFDCDY